MGKIDYDTMGGADGNWFVKDHFGYRCNPTSVYQNATSMIFNTVDSTKQTYVWCHLAIAPHEVDTSAWIFSTGWWKDSKGDPKQFLIDVESGKIAPNAITEKSGVVIYRLTFIVTSESAGSPARPDGGTAPYAIGYCSFKPSTQQTAGYLAIQIRTDGTMAIDVSTDTTPITGLTANPRIYSR